MQLPRRLLVASLLVPLAEGQALNETWTLVAADPAPGDRGGESVAAHADVLVCGAPFKHLAGKANAGAVYVFEPAPGGWTETAKLTAPDPQLAGLFGQAVAADADRIAVGAPMVDGTDSDSGAVYVFDRLPAGWTFSAKLTSADAEGGDFFGISVDVEGDRLVAGARGDDDGGGSAGAVYVFERTTGGWTQVAKLTSSDAKSSDVFGTSVDLEGERLLVGAPRADGAVPDAGAAYLFERTPSSWTEVAKLTAADGGSLDWLGGSVALSGKRALAGAGSDDHAGVLSGSAYVFEQGPTGWFQAAKLTVDDAGVFAELGSSVDLDGRAAVVGAPGTALAHPAGAAYLFEEGDAGWTQTAKLVGSSSIVGDELGTAVGFAGGIAIVGSPFDDVVGHDSGAAYAFEIEDRSLFAEPLVLSIATGGVQSLLLDAGVDRAGLPHLVLGSLAGTSPPLPIDGLLLPLVVDAYTTHTLLSPNTPPLAGSIGFLDASGSAAATFTLPPGLPPSLAGASVHHAYVVIELVPGLLGLSLISNAVELELLP